MSPEERARLIKRYQEGYEAVATALEGFTPQALDLAPSGEWSAREIVHHLADTEVFRSARLRVLLTEDDPFIAAFNEADFPERLHYYRPIDASLALFKAAMDANLELVTLLFPEDWARAGRHEEFGPFSVETWLERAAGHPHEHAGQLIALSRQVQQ